jgi:hypothetical protein
LAVGLCFSIDSVLAQGLVYPLEDKDDFSQMNEDAMGMISSIAPQKYERVGTWRLWFGNIFQIESSNDIPILFVTMPKSGDPSDD